MIMSAVHICLLVKVLLYLHGCTTLGTWYKDSLIDGQSKTKSTKWLSINPRRNHYVNVLLLPSAFTIDAIPWYETGPVLCILSQPCEHWLPGALASWPQRCWLRSHAFLRVYQLNGNPQIFKSTQKISISPYRLKVFLDLLITILTPWDLWWTWVKNSYISTRLLH